MLSIERMRKLLGGAVKELSDSEIAKIRDEMYRMASVLFDHWVCLQERETGQQDSGEHNRVLTGKDKTVE